MWSVTTFPTILFPAQKSVSWISTICIFLGNLHLFGGSINCSPSVWRNTFERLCDGPTISGTVINNCDFAIERNLSNEIALADLRKRRTFDCVNVIVFGIDDSVLDSGVRNRWDNANKGEPRYFEKLVLSAGAKWLKACGVTALKGWPGDFHKFFHRQLWIIRG